MGSGAEWHSGQGLKMGRERVLQTWGGRGGPSIPREELVQELKLQVFWETLGAAQDGLG